MAIRKRGSIHLVVQAVGKTSRAMVAMNVGDALADLLGPLGQPATIEKVGHVVCVAGGVGVAELLPVARAFRKAGNHVTALVRSALRRTDSSRRGIAHGCDEVHVGHRRWLGGNARHGGGPDAGMEGRADRRRLGAAHVIGPIPMMRCAAALTREWGVHTFASLNPIMVDGTGMCGGCRVTVGGKVKFACVDGPEFDAHQVDFDELTRRTRAYIEQERISNC